MTKEAEDYMEEVVKTAEGDAQRFLSIYGEYKNAKEITARRMYLETMELVLSRMTKVIIDSNQGQGSGVVPYLPLNELTRPSSNTGGSQ
jgi:membrane protease subunit HflK